MAPLRGQTEWSLSGYLTNLPVYQGGVELPFFQSDPMFLDLSRLRLRPSILLDANTRISLEYETSATYFTADRLFSLSGDKTNRQLFRICSNCPDKRI